MSKRLIDFILASIGIIILSPVLVLVAITVRYCLGSPILYLQRRPGLNEKAFTLVKFRTMREVSDLNDIPLPDAHRLTKVGKFLRSWSLDELPELWNVARGEMSLVGPRPLLMQYLPLYTCEQRRRHQIRPGLTGWAQINGRNSLDWEERFQMDVWYVDNRSFFLDLRILFLTFRKIIIRDGISARGNVTMPPFQGARDTESRR